MDLNFLIIIRLYRRFIFFFTEIFYVESNIEYVLYEFINAHFGEFVFSGSFLISLQVIFYVVLSSWARSVGPRARVDFLSDLTWKKLLSYLIFALLAHLLFFSLV